jgi:flavin reductase (DIM6/NTAB) family NADH-FMN oxidoreductase RutF
MELDPKTAGVVDVYQLLVGLVTPRPIAWVSTCDDQGRPNLAPYSFFNAFGANPPVVVFSPTLRRDGTKKNTLKNIERLGEFVIHITTDALAKQMNLTAKEIPEGESEFDLAGLTPTPAQIVKPPRILEALAALECRVMQIIPVGNGPISANLVIGEVVYFHCSNTVLDANGRVDPRKLGAVGRLGGEFYARTTDLFELPRP